ncbi:MAG: TIM barrel protein [Cyclobacteriaceae bacterium]|nr:TIM barrel protein [Cyclobacteriaceae bacterium]
MTRINRKQALKRLVAGTAAMTGLSSLTGNLHAKPLQGNINHSVCQWCYSSMPLEDLVLAAKDIGITSIDLLKADQWKVAIKHGLTCAMGYASDLPLTKGFNDISLHARLLNDYQIAIPKAADAGLKNLICFSGNAHGLTPQQGINNCARGLAPVLEIAEKYKITICMELLNSKVDHGDYQCDKTPWGVALCDRTGSDYFKLLYDIYHMQIMEGDVIATITKYSKYIAHYHTAGVPGRHELDENQELFYPAIMRAIVKSGFTGFVAQEFIPTKENKIASLREAINLCDV